MARRVYALERRPVCQVPTLAAAVSCQGEGPRPLGQRQICGPIGALVAAWVAAISLPGGKLIAALGIGAMLASSACYGDLAVVQGTVVGLDGTSHTLTVRDERVPNAVLPFLFKSAPPVKPGEVVRIAFRRQGDTRSVVRLMNVTRARKGDKKQK